MFSYYRGRGSRALLTRCKRGAVVHDASYHFAVQLEGPEVCFPVLLNFQFQDRRNSHSFGDTRNSCLYLSSIQPTMHKYEIAQ